ncbi:hypothetical protein Csa_019803 [Cucumis sativus]|uniref:Uncharacterized protein n=1 Tax=Cucumis sativus TaxID=3659 RepID=A0A0A0LUP2_CUCSA|nr:hypothetical protein Csa_019803 [Cucumis sativus]
MKYHDWGMNTRRNLVINQPDSAQAAPTRTIISNDLIQGCFSKYRKCQCAVIAKASRFREAFGFIYSCFLFGPREWTTSYQMISKERAKKVIQLRF